MADEGVAVEESRREFVLAMASHQGRRPQVIQNAEDGDEEYWRGKRLDEGIQDIGGGSDSPPISLRIISGSTLNLKARVLLGVF